MILAPSDVSSLSQSLHHWEIAEYVSEGFVILACGGEMVADVGEKWLGEKRKKRLERRSTILLVAALSVSLTCLVRTNELSGSVIGSLGDKAEEALALAVVEIAHREELVPVVGLLHQALLFLRRIAVDVCAVWHLSADVAACGRQFTSDS